MKRLTGYGLILIVLGSIWIFDGCKKGDDDPFFSIHSRKARVTGDWTIEFMERNVTQSLSDGSKAVVDFKIDGDKIIIKVDSFETSHDTTNIITTGIVNEVYYRFDRNSKMDHVFSYQLTKEKSVIDENTSISTYDKIVTTIKDRATGSWDFISKIEKNGVNKYKNKERISLIFESKNNVTTIVTTHWQTDADGIIIPGTYDYNSIIESSENKYANGEYAEIWILKELRNKKIVMERNIDNLVQTQIIDSTSTSSSYSEKGTQTITLKPRQ